MSRKILVTGGLILLISTAALAAFNLSGTAAPNALCEIIEVTGSPVYTIAAGGVVNATAYSDSANNVLSFKADSAGNISYQYGENEETLKNGVPIGAKTLMIRAWDGGKVGTGKYSYSQTFPLGTSQGGIQAISLSFPAWYNQGKPPAPGITATQTGYDLQIRPLINAVLDLAPLAGYEIVSIKGGKFNYKISTGGVAVDQVNSDLASLGFDPTKLSAGLTYHIVAYARNGFGDGSEAAADVATKGLAMTGELIWNFYKGTTLAINQHELYIDPTKPISFANGNGYTIVPGPVKVKDLVNAINAYAVAKGIPANTVTTVGWWDSDRPDQQMFGYVIAGSTYTKSSTFIADNGDEPLKQNRTYQFSVQGAFDGFSLKN
ncbi:MAG: hypothetical protein PHG97_01785 [Candidatus Margulisbacteria bacterium]|nr:hypothetical protein [Candidatus Margulisiibacteriota bacterium]